MHGWILHNILDAAARPDAYEVRRFQEVAEESGIELRVLRPEQFDLIVTRDDRRSVRVDADVVALPDFLLPRLGAKTTYFALAVIRHLERLGVRSFNRSAAIETVRDKLYTQQILAASDLPFAKTMLVKFPVDADLVEKYLGFPVVVKTISGSRGVGVFLCENRAKFQDLVDLIGAAESAANIILQELVESSFGRDLRVVTVGGRAIACMQRTAKGDGFKANFSAGGSVESHQLTPEIEWLALEASRVFDLDIAGVDLLFEDGHFKICEVNSAPGFRGIEQCCDINVAGEIFEFIRVRLGMQ
jgi:gamma-F420-2:alpha-L-glutamate ligase